MAGGFIGEQEVERVREANDIVSVISDYAPVKRRGRDYWCCCPFHQEKTPSCRIDSERQLWHCFGCGEGGDVFGFIMKAEDLTFPEAVRRLAERAHIELEERKGSRGASSSEKARLKEVCTAAAEFFHFQLMRSKSGDASRARAYLSGRSLGGEVPRRWNLGFAPGNDTLTRHLTAKGFTAEELLKANVAVRGRDGRLHDRFFNRVMFPINDAQGDCIAFGGRVIGFGEPKYLNTQETPLFHKSKVLYGLDKAKAAMTASGTAVVVEGYTDVIALSESGIPYVVATLGTALTTQHIRVLGRHAQRRIVYLFDGDNAGQRAADRALAFIDSSMTPEAGQSRIDLCAVTLPDDLDPADFVSIRGADALKVLIDQAQPLLKYGIERRLRRYDLSNAEGRQRALIDALEVLAPIKDSLLAKDYAVQIAGQLRQRESDVLNALAALTPPRYDAYRENHETTDTAKEYNANRPSKGFSRGEPRRTTSAGSASEANRRTFERGFLSLLVQNPDLATDFGDSLAQVNWHVPRHGELAQFMLDALEQEPHLSAPSFISKISLAFPRATGYLTATTTVSEQLKAQGDGDFLSPADEARFVAEELELGDLQDAIDQLRYELSKDRESDSTEFDDLFNTVVAMQKDLNERRRRHRPLT